jgi:Tfp pilus assembly protein PilF
VKRSSRIILALLALLLASSARPASAALSAAEDAETNARSGAEMLNAGDPEQALIHFRLAYEAVKNPDYVFNMAQCEYLLGQLKEALEHYQQYLAMGDTRRRSEALEMARLRIKAINLRQSVFSINVLPAGADVRIEGPKTVTGRVPADFRVPRGTYRITVSRPAYVSQTSEVTIGIAESKSLFFHLQPIPGRLQLSNLPSSATLYVRGNRARNPYDQVVEPGSYEIYAEASDHLPRREIVQVDAGQHLQLDFRLQYVQRSGRPELIGFWTVAGVIAGATAVGASLDSLSENNAKTASSLVAAGGLVGGAVGLVLATAYVPDYIRDNLALFRIGAMSVGAIEGAAIGAAVYPKESFKAGWVGGVMGLGAGAVAGIALDGYAPNYGRVVVIESGAGLGALAGALMATAVKPADTSRYAPAFVLGGLNLGLGAGLALAYLPDQRARGPTWKRVVLIDLAAAAGAFAGAVGTQVACLTTDDPKTGKPRTAESCSITSDEGQAARFALIGGAAGLVAGWFLTRNLDREPDAAEHHALNLLPLPSAIPVQGRDGPTVVPGLTAQGRF